MGFQALGEIILKLNIEWVFSSTLTLTLFPVIFITGNSVYSSFNSFDVVQWVIKVGNILQVKQETSKQSWKLDVWN